MALAPRSSLRSLVLLLSHGKPRLSSFFSSSSSIAATGVPPPAPGAGTPPAVQPAAPPGPKLPVEEEFVLHPIPGGPRPCPRPRGAVKDVTNKACLNAPEDDSSAYPTPDHASSSTPEPVSDKPPWDIFEDPGHLIRDPPPRPPRRGCSAVTDEPEWCAQEHPKYPVPDGSSDKVFSSCSYVVPPSAPGPCTPTAPDVQPPDTPALADRSGHKLPDHEESVVQPLPDPPGNRLNPVTNEPAQYTQEHLKYPTPESSSHKLPAHEELVIHPLPGGPRPRPRGAVKDLTDKACLNAPEDPTYPTPDHGSSSPSEDLLEDPRHPVRDPPRGP